MGVVWDYLEQMFSVKSFQDLVKDAFSDNPVFIILIIAFVIKTYMRLSAAPPPVKQEEGSSVYEIKTKDQWNDAVDAANESGATVIVYFYATWCPPCKQAAPLYSNLSKVYCTNKSICQFWKVDCDKMQELARKNKISKMPTFKFFKKSVEVDEMIGWDEMKFKSLLQKHITIEDFSLKKNTSE